MIYFYYYFKANQFKILNKERQFKLIFYLSIELSMHLFISKLIKSLNACFLCTYIFTIFSSLSYMLSIAERKRKDLCKSVHVMAGDKKYWVLKIFRNISFRVMHFMNFLFIIQNFQTRQLYNSASFFYYSIKTLKNIIPFFTSMK